MIITITGLPGSGKTTIAKALSETLGRPWYSMGDLYGQMAKERGLTVDELNALGETEDMTDKNVDEYQRRLGQSGKDMIVEGRLSWHFIPDSYKIFLDVESGEGARRIYGARTRQERTDEKLYTSVEDAKKSIEQRLASDRKRYQQYYGLDFMDRNNYDLVIDTTTLSPPEALEQILTAMRGSGILSAL